MSGGKCRFSDLKSVLKSDSFPIVSEARNEQVTIETKPERKTIQNMDI